MNISNPIGTNIRIEPFDNCALPAEVFPLRGKIVRRLCAIGGADDWYLIKLEKQFEYQKKIGEPYQFKLFTYDKVLVRSRWQGHKVGEQEETSVFLSLLPPNFSIESDFFESEQCDHVAWGLCYTEDTELCDKPNQVT
jgi:hypothetical protein